MGKKGSRVSKKAATPTKKKTKEIVPPGKLPTPPSTSRSPSEDEADRKEIHFYSQTTGRRVAIFRRCHDQAEVLEGSGITFKLVSGGVPLQDVAALQESEKAQLEEMTESFYSLVKQIWDSADEESCGA